ncbi:MAG: hypothetical protein Q9228_006121, partial [Teloschistes exilis]
MAAAAANLQPAAQPQATGFLSLPLEIRLQIYDDVLKGQTIAIIWSLPPPAARRILRAQGLSLRKRFWRTRSHARDSGEDHPAALMHTSHLLRQEALVFFYRNTHFHLDLGPNPIQGLRAFVNNGLGDPAFAIYIRKISLELNLRTEPYHPWFDRELVVRLGRWVARLPALRELTLA